MRAKYFISVDTGKREFVGCYKTGFFAMRVWRKYVAHIKVSNEDWAMVYTALDRKGNVVVKAHYATETATRAKGLTDSNHDASDRAKPVHKTHPSNPPETPQSSPTGE